MDPLLDGLDARQRDAVTSPANPLAILAPAGAGKTRVLTRRIAFRAREGSVEPRHVLAVTFTRKAAGELVDRVAALGVEGVTAGTFHALALAQLRRRALEQHRPVPTVLASKARILGSLARDRGAGPVNAATLSDLAAEIEWAKARLVRPEQYATAARAAGRRPPRPFTDVADIYARYEGEKRTKRTYDFDDLLWLCADAIEEDPTFAATQRWRFRHVFVDEFQDATPLQLRLLRAWLGASPDLCVVGDAAQAIYGFAGADATPLLAFADRFPGAAVIALDRNYRSTPQVVAVAESVLAPDTAGTRPEILAVRPGGPAPTTRAYDDDAAEAAGVAQGCWEAFTSGVPWSAIGVLFRTNAQSSLFEAALTRRGIPCRVPTGGRFVERPAVRTLLDELRKAERETRGRAFAELLADLAAGHVEEPQATTPAQPSEPPVTAPSRADEELREHRDALLRLGRDYLASEGGTGSVAGFVAWLDLATRNEQRGGPAVDLLTFHRAKGLEWRVVFVTGLELGLVPISWATAPPAVAEERRLLHVALGRAEDELHLSWARQRTVNGRRSGREPSPWLPALVGHAQLSAAAPVDPRDGLAAVRAALHAAQPPQPVPRGRRRSR